MGFSVSGTWEGSSVYHTRPSLPRKYVRYFVIWNFTPTVLRALSEVPMIPEPNPSTTTRFCLLGQPQPRTVSGEPSVRKDNKVKRILRNSSDQL